MKHWTLKGKEVVECDLMEWGRMMNEIGARRVAVDVIEGYRISTVFLGIDHGFGVSKRPLLFETMVFGADEEWMDRASTWEEAERQHRDGVAWVRRLIIKKKNKIS